MKYTFVTVAHGDDIGWQQLQARSMQIYLPLDLVAEIIVVENSTSGQSAKWRDVLGREYGALAPLVRFIEAKEIAEMPSQTGGWFSQQVLKLMVSQIVTTDRYVLLDAKNHLVFALARTFLEAGSRIRSRLESYHSHPMKPVFERTLCYFGMNPSEHVAAFLPTTTPFTLPTSAVRDLVKYVAEREKKPFPLAFLSLGLSEFFLFASFIISSGRKIQDIYDLSGSACPTIWEENARCGVDDIARLIAKCQRNGLPFFAVHRRAVPELNEVSRWTVADFWHQRGLFKTVREGVNFLGVPHSSD